MIIAVTADKYELTMYVAENMYELSRISGIPNSTILSGLRLKDKTKRKAACGYRFYEIDEDESEERHG